MTRLLTASFLVALTPLLPGCATTSGGSGVEGAEYSENLGRQLYRPLRDAMDKILLQQHGYRMQRGEEQYGSLYYETQWEVRTPTAEERDQGITRLRHRIVIRGRRVGDDPSGGALYRVTLEAENQGQSEMRPDWTPAPMSEEFARQLRGIVQDMSLELRTGVRR